MRDVEPDSQDAEERRAVRKVGLILAIVVLVLLALPFAFVLWP